MDERHLHFNVIQSLWFVLFLIVVVNLAKYLANRFKVPGLTGLINNL